MQRPVPQGGSPRGHVLRVARPGGDVDGDVVRADEGARLVVGRRTDVDLAQAIRRGQRSCPSQRARRRWSAPRHRSAAAAGPPRPHRRRSRLAEGQQDNIPRAAPCGSPSGAHEDRTAHPVGAAAWSPVQRHAAHAVADQGDPRSRGPPAGSPSASRPWNGQGRSWSFSRSEAWPGAVRPPTRARNLVRRTILHRPQDVPSRLGDAERPAGVADPQIIQRDHHHPPVLAV